jgi:indole-3-glycerol phosphate synthase
MVSEYHRVGAPCLSVVTGRWFGGTHEMQRDVARLTNLPIVRKDFIATESQIVHAGHGCLSGPGDDADPSKIDFQRL